ncbi:MAG TPA: RNA methyltransferase [Gemmatimonadaceae bacterium]|nr:RNA methyltransferase [Gemmatimonadaceae bacterium]
MSLLTLARDLQRRKARERHRLFVAEGIRTVEELIRSPLRVRGALASPQLEATPRGSALRTALAGRTPDLLDVTEREFDSAASTETPQGVLAIAEIPRHDLDRLTPPTPARVLLLDGVQDPGNVGTILRTAAAFGASATLALPGTVDLWNAKVVRSAMGAHFHHIALHCTWEAADAFRARHGIALWAADAAGAALDPAAAPKRLALVLGNEGAGMSEDARARNPVAVSLPIGRAVESLNVAVAAGIFLYELRT